MADSLRKLAAQLARVTSDVESLKRWASTPQLPASSLDDASVPEKDADGNVVSRWGKQEDNTHGVVIFDGPVPPVPAGLEAEDGAGVVTAVWGGTYANDVGKYDFHAVEIYAAPEPFQYIEEATLVGAIPDPDGGRVTFGRAPGTWHIGAVTLSQAGKRSPVSALVTAEVTRVADSADLERLEGAFTTSTEPPTAADGQGKPEDAYWTQVDAEGAQVARWRWNGNNWIPAPLGVQFIPEAYVDYLAANAAFVGDLFGRNISVSGEITAYSENYSTTVSQAGVQMYSNNALDRTLQYTLDDLDVGWPSDNIVGMTMVDGWGYFFQQNKVVARDETGTTRWTETVSDHISRVDISGTADGIVLLEWRQHRPGEFDYHLTTLDPATGQPNLPLMITGAFEGPAVGVAIDPDDPSTAIIHWHYYGREQWLERWDLTTGTRTAVFAHQRSGEGQWRGLTVYDGHVFIASGFITNEGGHHYSQYDIATGELIRQVILPGPVLDLAAGDGTVWASLGTNLVMGHSATTGQMQVVAKRTEGGGGEDNLVGLAASGNTLYGLDYRQGQHYEVATYEVVEDRHLRVNVDNHEGKLTVAEVEIEQLSVRGWQVTPSTKHYIRGSNIFSSLEPGFTIATSSLAVIDEDENGSTVTISVTIFGIDRSAGNQRIEIGTLHPDLAPGLAVALPGYYTNGAATAAITGAGSVSLRWSSGSAANQIFFATSYAIDRGE